MHMAGMNPNAIKQFMDARNQFAQNHPKFAAFMQTVAGTPFVEGTVIEITVTRPGEEPLTTNMRVTESDLALLNGLQEMGGPM
jgi:uncharacterized protein YlxW (UPF0749 family)